MALAIGNVATPANGTGASLNVTLPTPIAANDIIMLWAVCERAAGGASSFGWPTGFAEIIGAQLLTSGGTHTGYGAIGWKRADGTEDATTVAITRAAGGAGTVFYASSFIVTGAITTGTPYEVAGGGATGPVENSPNASTTGDFPSITIVDAAAMIISGILKGGLNGNYGTPTNWTQISSNGTTSGTDAGADWDYRLPGSAGSYDPASPTLTTDADTCWGAFQLAMIPPASGTPQLCAATLASTSDLSGALKVEKLLASTLASTSVLQATIQIEKALASVLASSSSLDGALNPSGVQMAAILASTGDLAAILRDEKQMATILSSSGALNGILLDAKTMQTVMASSSTLAAALRDEKALAAVLASQGFLNANLQDELPSAGRLLRLLLGVGK
jgi:hypothetical protein